MKDDTLKGRLDYLRYRHSCAETTTIFENGRKVGLSIAIAAIEKGLDDAGLPIDPPRRKTVRKK